MPFKKDLMRIEKSQLLPPLETDRIMHLIQQGIKVEKKTIEKHKKLGNDMEYLSSEKNVTQGEILLSLLRQSGS